MVVPMDVVRSGNLMNSTLSAPMEPFKNSKRRVHCVVLPQRSTPSNKMKAPRFVAIVNSKLKPSSDADSCPLRLRTVLQTGQERVVVAGTKQNYLSIYQERRFSAVLRQNYLSIYLFFQQFLVHRWRTPPTSTGKCNVPPCRA